MVSRCPSLHGGSSLAVSSFMGLSSFASAVVGVPTSLARKGLLFEFIAYLTGLNSNPSGSSDPWVAAQPSGLPGGGPGGRVVIVVSELRGPKRFGPSVSCRRVLLLLLGARAASEVAGSLVLQLVVFVLGLRIRVGVSRRLSEPACGVAFTGAGLWSVELVDGVLALLDVPVLLECVLVGCPPVVGLCVWPCVLVHRCALCSTQSASLHELSRCFVCRVAPLVECSRSSSLLVLVEVRFPQNCVVLISGCCGIVLWVE
ncbi:hypothetical protein Taro_028097, partial [Colocasia esculenta]|nr:hypothetical protein [Colocasia esculenta]